MMPASELVSSEEAVAESKTPEIKLKPIEASLDTLELLSFYRKRSRFLQANFRRSILAVWIGLVLLSIMSFWLWHGVSDLWHESLNLLANDILMEERVLALEKRSLSSDQIGRREQIRTSEHLLGKEILEKPSGKTEEKRFDDQGKSDGLSAEEVKKELDIGKEGLVSRTQDTSNTRPAAESTPENEIIYTVRRGDNLYRIGLRYGMDWKQVAKANNIQYPNHLVAGRILRIPAPEL